MATKAPVILCILDGWGIGSDPSSDAPALAQTPTMDGVLANCPNATLVTYGPEAGLPKNQMGNSEVGHTNIGAGRVVAMDLGQIDLAIEDGSFAQNPALLEFAAKMTASGGTAHLMGVVSDGGVHSHIAHILAATHVLADLGVPVRLHAITDGRDVAPQSAQPFLDHLIAKLPQGAKIATLIGRYYAMDRDNRWERVAQAFTAMTQAAGQSAPTATEALAAAYGRGETDEFVLPTVIGDFKGMADGDGLFCLNFRADRARQILRAFGEPGFAEFDTSTRPHLAGLLGMVDYSSQHNTYMTTAYPKQSIANTLGEWVSAQGLRQFRLAETEKYPHVTFFLNGGVEPPYPGEERHMPASPKVATYDLAPEMAAAEVTETCISAINQGFDLIVVNFANPDMVGHTGDIQAAIKACEAVDTGLGKILTALQAKGGAMVLTADHGNCDMMVDPETGGPHTAHTLNPVPVAVIGGPEGATVRAGRLADLAPTVLQLMGLDQPPEMTGNSLLE